MPFGRNSGDRRYIGTPRKRLRWLLNGSHAHLAQLVQAGLHQLRVTALELGRDQDGSKSGRSAGVEHACHLIKRQLAVRFD